MSFFYSSYCIITGTPFSTNEPLWSCTNAWNEKHKCKHSICNNCYKPPKNRRRRPKKRKSSDNTPSKCQHNEIDTLEISYEPKDKIHLHKKFKDGNRIYLPTICFECRNTILYNGKDLTK